MIKHLTENRSVPLQLLLKISMHAPEDVAQTAIQCRRFPEEELWRIVRAGWSARAQWAALSPWAPQDLIAFTVTHPNTGEIMNPLHASTRLRIAMSG